MSVPLSATQQRRLQERRGRLPNSVQSWQSAIAVGNQNVDTSNPASKVVAKTALDPATVSQTSEVQERPVTRSGERRGRVPSRVAEKQRTISARPISDINWTDLLCPIDQVTSNRSTVPSVINNSPNRVLIVGTL